MRRYEILMEFAGEQKEIPSEALSDVMLLDLYLAREFKEQAILCFQTRSRMSGMIWDYRKAKKIPKTAHIEVFRGWKEASF